MQNFRHISTGSRKKAISSRKMFQFNSQKNKWMKATHPTENQPAGPSSIQLLTWNIDFMANNREERLLSALKHIQSSVFSCASDAVAPPPSVVCLQELRYDVVPVLLAHPWVRAHFQATTPASESDSHAGWPSGARYGSVTLVSRSVPVAATSSLTFCELDDGPRRAFRRSAPLCRRNGY